MRIPDHPTCLLRNLNAGQEATVRTGHGTTGWFQIGKGVRQGYILSPYLFNLYEEYLRRNAGLEEAQAGIKIAGRNINNSAVYLGLSDLAAAAAAANYWRRKWQPTPVLLPRENHGWSSLAQATPSMVSQRVRHD